MVFEAVFEVLSFTFDDSNPRVISKNLILLERLINSGVRLTDQHLPYHMEEIAENLVKMFIDTINSRKSTVRRLFIDLPMIFPISCVISILAKHKKKVKLDPRLLSAKLIVMD